MTCANQRVQIGDFVKWDQSKIGCVKEVGSRGYPDCICVRLPSAVEAQIYRQKNSVVKIGNVAGALFFYSKLIMDIIFHIYLIIFIRENIKIIRISLKTYIISVLLMIFVASTSSGIRNSDFVQKILEIYVY